MPVGVARTEATYEETSFRPIVHDLLSDKNLQALVGEEPGIDVESIKVCMLFLQAALDITRRYDTFLTRYDLSASKFTLLLVLQRSPEEILTPAVCAERTRVSRGTMTNLLFGLERQGLIHREPHPSDRRMTRIRLSERGGNLLQRVLPEHFVWTDRLMSALSKLEQSSLATKIEKLRTQLAEMGVDGLEEE